MPYIVTVTPREPVGWEDDADFNPTRTAVATLDEARIAVANIYDGIKYSDVEAAMDNCWEAENLPTEGKTIGPLPDGTVIEVQLIAWGALDALAPGEPSATLPETDAERGAILAAFNGAQA